MPIVNRNVRKQAVEHKTTIGQGFYDGKELKPFEGRAGAMDAFNLPSVRGSQRVMPQMYMAKGEK